MVLWTAPSFDGGAPITSYTATSDPDGRTCTPADDAATACTVTGLTNGTAYTFTVTADNEAGTSAASQLSAAATPAGPGSPERADRGVRRPGGGRVVDRAGRYGRTTDHQLRGDGVAGGAHVRRRGRDHLHGHGPAAGPSLRVHRDRHERGGQGLGGFGAVDGVDGARHRAGPADGRDRGRGQRRRQGLLDRAHRDRRTRFACRGLRGDRRAGRADLHRGRRRHVVHRHRGSPTTRATPSP